MSDYLNSADSDSDTESRSAKMGSDTTVEQQTDAIVKAATAKGEGNDLFGAGNYEEALLKYSEAIKTLSSAGLPKDSLILLNRSATFLALKRYVPALNDANQGDYMHDNTNL